MFLSMLHVPCFCCCGNFFQSLVDIQYKYDILVSIIVSGTHQPGPHQDTGKAGGLKDYIFVSLVR